MKRLRIIPWWLVIVSMFVTFAAWGDVATEQDGALLQKGFIWTGEAVPEGPHFTVFRRSFELERDVKEASLDLFADVRYVLWINGRYVVRGPCRFDPKGPQYDRVEVTRFLKPGKNALAVLVLAQASNGKMMTHAPGLTARLNLTDTDGKALCIASDNQWKWNGRTRFRVPQVEWGTFRDRVDARLDDGDWTQADYDDRGWKNAAPIEGGAWGPLVLRKIPLLKETPVVAQPPAGRKWPVVLEAQQEIVLDLGRMVQGYEVIELEADAGAVLEVEHGEGCRDGRISDTYDTVNRYVARAGRQTHMACDIFGHRYLRLRAAEGKLRILGAAVVDCQYPWTETTAFSCDDPLLTELWKRAILTIRMCSSDGYMDCTLRERASWLGDAAVVEYPITRVTLAGPEAPARSDARLMANLIRHIAQSQLPDGRLRARHPADFWDLHAYIEDYSCLWVQTVRQVYEHSGDTALVREVWPALVRQMQWFLDRRTATGLVKAREFVIFDNPNIYKECEGTTLNAFIWRALVDAAVLGRAIGEQQQAETYEAAAKSLAEAFNRELWDESAGTYSAALMNGQRLSPTAHAALLPLNRGIVPDSRRDSVRAWLLAHYGGPGGIAFPYTWFWLLEEFYAMDTPAADELAVNMMRDRWKGMASRMDTGTLTEAMDGSCEACHNFGAVPAYFLNAYVLGVRLDGPAAQKRILVEPRPGPLHAASGTVVTEVGTVPMAWRRGADDFAFAVTVPPGATALLRIPMLGEKATLWVDGKPVTQRRGRWLETTLSAGKHTGRMTFIPPPQPVSRVADLKAPGGCAAFEADLPPANRLLPVVAVEESGAMEATGGGANADAIRNRTTRNGSGGGDTIDDGKTFRGYGAGNAVTFRLDLAARPQGYALEEVRSFAGHIDARASQAYTVSIATVAEPAKFVHVITASVTSNGGATELRVPAKAGGVAAVRLEFANGPIGFNVYREIALIGK